MAVDFTLRDNRLSLRQWRGFLYAWQQRFGTDLYEPAVFSDGEPATAHVWGPESTRGVVLTCTTATFGSLASRADWVRGFHVMRCALRQGGGYWERETGEIYGIEQLIPEQAHEEGTQEFLASARAVTGRTTLLLRDYEISLSRAELTGRISDVETALATRVRRYATATRAATMMLDDESRAAIWNLSPTIIGIVDQVLIEWKDGLPLPLDRVLAVLGDRAERLGADFIYLPAADEDLLNRLERAEEEPLMGEIIEPVRTVTMRRRRRRW